MCINMQNSVSIIMLIGQCAAINSMQDFLLDNSDLAAVPPIKWVSIGNQYIMEHAYYVNQRPLARELCISVFMLAHWIGFLPSFRPTSHSTRRTDRHKGGGHTVFYWSLGGGVSLVYLRVAVKYQFTEVNSLKFCFEYTSDPKIIRSLQCQTIFKTLITDGFQDIYCAQT